MQMEMGYTKAHTMFRWKVCRRDLLVNAERPRDERITPSSVVPVARRGIAGRALPHYPGTALLTILQRIAPILLSLSLHRGILDDVPYSRKANSLSITRHRALRCERPDPGERERADRGDTCRRAKQAPHDGRGPRQHPQR